MHRNPQFEPLVSRKRDRQYLIPIAAFLVVVGVGIAAWLGAFGAKTPVAVTSFQLSGTITLQDSSNGEYGTVDITSNNGSCQGAGPYSDLSSGTAVIVANAQGQTVATGQLLAGQTDSNSDASFVDECTMPFTVPNVPIGLSNYTVTISHRGSQVVSAAEARSGVELTIGN